MGYSILNQFIIGLIIISFFFLIYPPDVSGQNSGEVYTSGGEHVKFNIKKFSAGSVKIINGKTISVNEENPDEIVLLIVTFKEKPLTLYHTAASLKKSSVSSIYSALQADHSSFRTALSNIKQQLSNQMKSDYSYLIKRDYYRALNGVSMQCKRGMINKIRSLPMVQNVSLDKEVKADLIHSVHQIRADIVQDSLGYTGSGVLIGDVDTGIDYDNPALGGGFGPAYRVIGGYDFANNDADPMDDHGHGTHVAGIIGANSGDTLRGVAPEVKFLAVKVLDDGGMGWTSDIIAGIEFCLDPDNNPATDDAVDFINMSLGGGPSPDFDNAVDNAAKDGVLSVVSAGNFGYGHYGTIGSPGTSETALTVGACDSAFNMAYFSSMGPDPIRSSIKPEVVAPGVNILSTILGNQTERWSGTSMAAPHATGTAALLRQKHPSWTPEEIKTAIINSAHSLGDNISIFAQGKGCIDALDAANSGMLVEPGVMSFGFVDLAQDVWKDTLNLSIRNFRSVLQNTQISILDGLPSGAALTFDKSSFSLNPGEETIITAVLTVPSSVPIISTEPFAYLGKIKVTSDSDNVIVPFSFIKSTTLVVTFDLQPSILWLIDREGGTVKEVNIQEGVTKYLVRISQGYSLDLLSILIKDTLGITNRYLVHHKIENPTGLSYLFVSHDQAAINMVEDSIYDIDNNIVALDSSSFAEISFQFVVYDERSGQHLISSSYSYGWFFTPNLCKIFFPPLDSLFCIIKSIIVPVDSDYYILNKPIFGLQTDQDIAIATGADNLAAYHLRYSFIDPYLPNPSFWNKDIIIGLNTIRAELDAWEGARRKFEFSALKNNFYLNKPDLKGAKNDKYFYSSVNFGVGYHHILYDSTILEAGQLSTPGFIIKDNGEAVFEQKMVKMPPENTPMPSEISTLYNYETLKSGDTIKIEQNAHLNFPDYMTLLNNGSVFMQSNNAWSIFNFYNFNGGIKQFNGVNEERSSFCQYWGIPLFSAQAFIHNRLQKNMKPFFPGEEPYPSVLYPYYQFGNIKNTDIFQILSDAHPYTILGQAGQCTADFEFRIPDNANSKTIFPSFDLLQVSENGRAVDFVRSDRNSKIRLVTFDPEDNVASVEIFLLLASGDEIALPVSYIGGNEYDASIPSYIPEGFIDVIARIDDAKGNRCELTASPGFYFGSPAVNITQDARLRLSSYLLNNVESIHMQPGDTLHYTLSYINFGSDTARNVVVTFPSTPYFDPIGPASWRIDSIAVNDTVHIPVSLLFLGKQQSADKYTHYSPTITWTSGSINYLRKHNILVDFQNDITDAGQTVSMVPDKFELYQNYPNPFNPSTTIMYDLMDESRVKIAVYDILGRLVATLVDETKRAGRYQAVWSAEQFASGVYFCRISAEPVSGNRNDSFIETKKLILMK